MKDAIVLLHGFNHDHRCWELVIDELKKTAPEVPKPLREYLWLCKTSPQEVRDRVNAGAIWEPVGLFTYPVTRKSMLHKNVFWLRTLQDRGNIQRMQSQYRDALGVDEELFIDAPHDCMLSHPKETADIILATFRKCL